MQVFTRNAVLRMISYTNLLHIQGTDPAKPADVDPELWNQQMTYAELLLEHMMSAGIIEFKENRTLKPRTIERNGLE